MIMVKKIGIAKKLIENIFLLRRCNAFRKLKETKRRRKKTLYRQSEWENHIGTFIEEKKTRIKECTRCVKANIYSSIIPQIKHEIL